MITNTLPAEAVVSAINHPTLRLGTASWGVSVADGRGSNERINRGKRAVTVRWPRVGLAILLVCTSVLYLWNLSAGGYGNTFYAAAAQAGAHSWSAWFFGALDGQGFITVDKPPAALWITGLSVRLFGMSSLSVLAPQAVMGVATVAVLFATVRRAVPDPRQGAVAGLIAGGILACTPAAALLFRFNNPDALLVLLLTVAAYCATRATQTGSWRWPVFVGAVVGAAFLTKMMQGFLVLPGFVAAYLRFAQTSWRSRLLHVAAAAAALVASAGWWVLIVALIPARSRPYIGGSTDNTVLNLALGYNGLNRILGTEAGSGSAGSALGSIDSTGLDRLFTSEMAINISWLLPVALFVIGLGAYSWARGRLDTGERAALVMWGCWLLVTGAVFSFMNGVVHAYYTITLAPAVGALVGLGSVWAWRGRSALDGRGALACMLGLAGIWSAVLLHDNHFGPHWLPWVLASICGSAAVVVLIGRRRLLTVMSVSVGAAAAMVGTLTISVATAAQLGHGPIPTTYGTWTGGQSYHALAPLLAAAHTPWSAAINGSQAAAALEIDSRTSVMAIGGWSNDPVPTLAQFIHDVRAGKITYYVEAAKHGVPLRSAREIRSKIQGTSNTLEIADWVAEHYSAVPMGETLVYYRLT
jgi:4-amino-4-deoxy-L-arabinose transferase-like glycosyltransferase